MVVFTDYPVISVVRGGKVSLNRATAVSNYRTVVTGATGSGKSTFALVKFISEVCSVYNGEILKKQSDETVILVQPSVVNVGNVSYEFNNRIRRHMKKSSVTFPKARLLAVSSEPQPGLFYITDVATIIKMISRQRDMPHVHIIVDECHQQSSEMVRLVNFLSVAKLFMSVIYITATLPNIGTGQGANRSTVVKELSLDAVNAVKTRSNFFQSPMNPNRYSTIGSGIVCYFAASYTQARLLQSYITTIPVTVLSEHTTHVEYSAYLQRMTVREPQVVILTPTVDSGVTIPANVFIDLGLTSGKMIVQRTVVDEVRNISDATRRQRMGRCGRLYEGIYVRDPAAGISVDGGDVELYRAGAAVLLSSYGYDTSTLGLSGDWDYIALADIDQCKAAVHKEGEPALALMKSMIDAKSNHWTDTQRQTFVTMFGRAMKVFVYGDNVFIAPIFDLTNSRFNPYDMVPKPQVIPVAQMLAANTSFDPEKMTDDDFVDVLVRNMGLIHRQVFDCLIDLMDNDAVWETKSRENVHTLYGKMADVLDALGKVKGYEPIDEFNRASDGKYTHRMGLRSEGRELGYTVKKEYCNSKLQYQPSMFMPVLKSRLRATASLGVLLDDPNRVVDLQPLVLTYGAVAKILNATDVKQVSRRKLGRISMQPQQKQPSSGTTTPLTHHSRPLSPAAGNAGQTSNTGVTSVYIGSYSGKDGYVMSDVQYTPDSKAVAYLAQILATDSGEPNVDVLDKLRVLTNMPIDATTPITAAILTIKHDYKSYLVEYSVDRDKRFAQTKLFDFIDALCLIFVDGKV